MKQETIVYFEKKNMIAKPSRKHGVSWLLTRFGIKNLIPNTCNRLILD